MQHESALGHLALLSAISPSHLLTTFGVIGVFAILLLEMALLVAFFLPGDTLLFLAGSATVADNALGKHLPLGWLLIAAAAGAVIGGQFGYEVGRRAGEQVHERPSRLIKREYVDRAQRFLDRFGGGKAVVLSRFVPVVRTFASPLVGIAGMRRSSYSLWNLVGGIVWTVGVILLGHWLGHVSFIRHYIEVLAVVVVVVSIVPVLFQMWRHRGAPGASAG